MGDLYRGPIGDCAKPNDRPQKALIAGGVAHLIHDGFSDMLYVFFPIWQGVLGLSFAEVGFLKTLFSGTMAIFQVPTGMLANRVGEFKLLLIGTVITSFAVIFYGGGTSTLLLGCLLVIGGFGSSVQHPLSSSLISGAHQENRKRRIALTVITTEAMTALCIYGIIILPLQSELLLAPLLGLALNGTSSVLYGSVPELVSVEHQKQAFAIFYTATIGAGAIAPFLYGLISDAIGITTTVMIIAVIVLFTIPLTLPLRRKLAQ